MATPAQPTESTVSTDVASEKRTRMTFDKYIEALSAPLDEKSEEEIDDRHTLAVEFVKFLEDGLLRATEIIAKYEPALKEAKAAKRHYLKKLASFED